MEPERIFPVRSGYVYVRSGHDLFANPRAQPGSRNIVSVVFHGFVSFRFLAEMGSSMAASRSHPLIVYPPFSKKAETDLPFPQVEKPRSTLDFIGRERNLKFFFGVKKYSLSAASQSLVSACPVSAVRRRYCTVADSAISPFRRRRRGISLRLAASCFSPVRPHRRQAGTDLDPEIKIRALRTREFYTRKTENRAISVFLAKNKKGRNMRPGQYLQG